MPRYLGLDWDHNQLHLLSATTTRAGLKVDRAVLVAEDATFDAKSGEALGQRLKQLMKEHKIAPAPLIASLGRDRVILKEIRHPPVPESEEATLVKFQAAKELTESPETMVLDYIPGRVATAMGDRKAQVFATRKEIPAAFQALARTAGLKLLTLAPRALGLAAAVPKEAAVSTVAIVVFTEKWAEFCVAREGQVLFTRPLSPGPALAGEVKRNLALFAGQAAANSGNGAVKALLLAGAESQEGLRDRLQDTLGLPIQTLDPLAGQEALVYDGPRAGFTGLVGLIRTWAAEEETPINFAEPREAKVQVNPNRNRYVLAGVACAGLLVMGLIAARLLHVNALANEVEHLTATHANLESAANKLGEETKVIDELKRWTQVAIPWRDELFDVTGVFPSKDGLVIKEWTAVAEERKGKGGAGGPKGKVQTVERYTGVMTFKGEVKGADDQIMRSFGDNVNKGFLSKDGRHWVDITGLGEKGNSAKSDVKEFKATIQLARQESNMYKLPQYKAPERPIVRVQAKESTSKKGKKGTAPPIVIVPEKTPQKADDPYDYDYDYDYDYEGGQR